MLSANDKLGPYEILEPIGKGGMGDVYRARDPRVGRDVAIKTSREQFGERFDREARAIAALNHPNICTLFDVGPNYLVMEFVEGETLADRIKKGPIALDESLHIARQIADALEAAHDKGIVHRDLKPGNVILKPDGTVKVLDFGLAKQTAASGSAANPEESPTLSMAATQAGVVLGTAAYMAPEQARGKQVDKRADIWAFGAVLYEMVTGRRLFRGDDLTDTLAAVVRDKPDLTAVPARLRTMLEACLQKDPRERLRDIGDVWRLLDAARAEDQQTKSGAHTWLWPLVATLLAALAALALWAPWREPPALPELTKVEISPPVGTSIGKFAVSPDGRKIAYFASGETNNGLWVRSLDDLTPVRVGGNLEGAGLPSFFWSADSRFVLFSGDVNYTSLMKADSGGGQPETLVQMQGLTSTLVGGSWGRDGTVLVGSFGGVWRMPGTGGKPVQLTAVSSGTSGHLAPILLPDAKHFLYLAVSGLQADSGVFVGSIDDKPDSQKHDRIVATNATPGFVPTPDPKVGILLFLRDGDLLAQMLDLGSFRLTGDSTRLASGLGIEVEFGGFSASNDVLAYFTGQSQNTQIALKWFDRHGEVAGTPALDPLSSPFAAFPGIRLSPNGMRAALGRTDPDTAGRSDVWLVDFTRNNALSRLTSGSSSYANPVWSADGSQIAYLSIEGGAGGQQFALARKSLSGSGAEEIVLPGNGRERGLNDWSRDGRLLLFTEQGEKTKSDLWVVPVDGDRKPEVFLNSEFNETQGQFSPDGHWVAYVSDEAGQAQVFIQPFPRGTGSSGKIPVGRGVMPRWRKDGKGLFYALPGGGARIMEVDFASSPSPAAGIPRQLFRLGAMINDSKEFLWDVSPSGDQFLLSGANPGTKGAEAPLTVVLNWQRMLEKTR